MDFYISDTHFGHAGIIASCNRPFADVAHMDRDMVQLWNARVGPEDHVWHLGDVVYRAADDPGEYLRQLNGRMHLIVGNHDGKGVLRLHGVDGRFESIDYALVRTDGEGRRMWLSHYPLAEPPKRTWALYGHVHGNADWPGAGLVMAQERSLNCCVEVNGYMPVTFDELVRSNERWREENRKR